MANPNYVLLERVVVGANGTTTVTFNNIPQSGYTDLKIVTSLRKNTTSANVYVIGFNGGSIAGSTLFNQGTGTGTQSSTNASAWGGVVNGSDYVANSFAINEIYIPNYLSNRNKGYSIDYCTENNTSLSYVSMAVGLWPSTAAISSLSFKNATTTDLFVGGSTFSLYGLAAVGTTPTVAPYALGGDVIETDGTYWYHAFLSSGTFTPNKALSCDVLVVAGGGGADNGGGGAGGVLAFSSQALSANTALTATVGAGGASAGGRTNGGNSSFGSITPVSVGGGYGGSTAGNTGGSGGGSWSSSGSTAGAAGTSGQGNSGGASGSGGGGGGGGAGGNGASATGSAQGGAGGAGVNTVTNWGSLSTTLSTLGLGVSGYIAGGGGGYGVSTNSSGGSGGGGTGSAGGAALAASAAIPNTGSGGGNGSSGTGGSGLIIVRYAI